MKAMRASSLGLAFGAAVWLSACAAPVKTRLADGTLVYQIDCSGSATGLNYCYERAGKTCGADGFTVVDANGKGVDVGLGSTSDMDDTTMLHASDKNALLVKCGD